VETMGEVIQHIFNEDPRYFTVQRGDSVFEISLPQDLNKRFISEGVRQFSQFRVPFVIDSILPRNPAEVAGLQKGDSIVGLAGEETPFSHQFVKKLSELTDSATTISFFRNDELMTLPIVVNKSGKIGIGNRPLANYMQVKREKYGFFEAFPAGFNKGFSVLVNYVKQLRFIFTKEGVSKLGGFGTIGSLFPASWNWSSFWYTTGFLSLILAFMNILPIPALDGGHVLFLLYEIVTRRKPSEKFMEHAQLGGMIILVALLLYANGNDLFRWLF
jgi:regulator of sigma E protease